MVLVDQNPVRLSEDAVKNTNTKLIFALPDASDRRRLGESIGLNEEQINSLVSMERGQFILWTQGHNPTRIQGINIEKEMKEKGLNTTYPTDEEVREYMEPFFEKHPSLQWIHPHVYSSPSEIYHPPVPRRNASSQKENRVLLEVRDFCEKVCSHPRCKKKFYNLTTEKERENYIIQIAKTIAKRHKMPDIKQAVQTLKEIINKQNT